MTEAHQLLALVLAIESVRLEIRGLDLVSSAGASANARADAERSASEALQIVRALAEQEDTKR